MDIVSPYPKRGIELAVLGWSTFMIAPSLLENRVITLLCFISYVSAFSIAGSTQRPHWTEQVG